MKTTVFRRVPPGPEITPFLVMDILERAEELERQGEKIIHLEIGEPDYDTPQVVKDAAYRAMTAGETQYTHSQGLMELREALAQHYGEKYRVSGLAGAVHRHLGHLPGHDPHLRGLLDPGDEVVLPNPHYACYPNVLRLVDAGPRYVPVREADGFQLNPAELGPYLTPRTKAMLINSPANPTGTLMPPEWMARLAELGPYVISDEIYHGLVYEGQEHSILEFTDRAFVINGFSKLYAMTGWRLGYLMAPPDFIRPLQKLMQNFFHFRQPLCAAGRDRGPDPGRGRDRGHAGRGTTPGAGFCWRGWPDWGSGFPSPPPGPFMSLSTPATSRPTPTPWPSISWRKPRSGWPRASISDPAAKAFCASPTPTPWKTLRRPWAGWRPYLAQRRPA